MGLIIRSNFGCASSAGAGVIPWIAVPIRMMHRQRCGIRLAWPMITPHVDEIDERSRTRSGLLELSANSTGGSTHSGQPGCKCWSPSVTSSLPLPWRGGRPGPPAEPRKGRPGILFAELQDEAGPVTSPV
jgi:hypothetical protein